MAIVQHLVVDQYSKFSAEVTVYGDARYPLDLTGYTAESQIRKSPTSTVAGTFNATVIDEVAGKISLTLSAEDTADLIPGRYLYDVVIVSEAGDRYRAIEGIVTVSAGITQPTPAG